MWQNIIRLAAIIGTVTLYICYKIIAIHYLLSVTCNMNLLSEICYYLQKLVPFARCCTSRNFYIKTSAILDQYVKISRSKIAMFQNLPHKQMITNLYLQGLREDVKKNEKKQFFNILKSSLFIVSKNLCVMLGSFTTRLHLKEKDNLSCHIFSVCYVCITGIFCSFIFLPPCHVAADITTRCRTTMIST